MHRKRYQIKKIKLNQISLKKKSKEKRKNLKKPKKAQRKCKS